MYWQRTYPTASIFCMLSARLQKMRRDSPASSSSAPTAPSFVFALLDEANGSPPDSAMRAGAEAAEEEYLRRCGAAPRPWTASAEADPRITARPSRRSEEDMNAVDDAAGGMDEQCRGRGVAEGPGSAAARSSPPEKSPDETTRAVSRRC